jgi:uncharacterized repeat protein (TIGR02543 family)
MRSLLSFAFLLVSTFIGLQGQDYTVTISANPALSGTTTGAGTYASGTNVTVTAVPSAGYQFVNWTENSVTASTLSSYTFLLIADRTLVANFSLLQYNITASPIPAEGGTVTGAGEYSHGATVTLTATPNSGYVFLNWSDGVGVVSTTAILSFEATSARTLTANFARRYSVTLESNPAEGGTTTGAGSYDAGANAIVTATPAAGYSFKEWKEGPSTVSTSNPYTFQVISDISLKAEFEPAEYQINTTSSPLSGGSVTGAGSYTHGTSVTLAATPSSGYSFVNWTEGGTQVSGNSSYTFTAESDRNLVANFSQNTYTVTTASNPPAGGTTDGGGNFLYGATATVTATPAAGYQFLNWTLSGTEVSTSSSYTFTVTSNRILVANFSTLTYNVTTSSNPITGGNTTGAGTFNSGSSVTVTATPSSGFQFVNWSESGTAVSTSQSYTFNITSNRTLVANFSLVSYSVSTSSLPAGGGTTTGGGSYNYGESATVTATPSTGYRFVNWTAGGTAVSTNASYTFTVTANRTLVANFSTLTYTITTSTSPAGLGSATGGGTYNHGASATVTAAPAAGYRFVNWTEGGTVVSTASSYIFTVNSNRSLLANYSINTYTVAASSSPAAGGTASGAGIYNHGTQATVTATPSAGYLFVNWTESGTTVSTNVSYSFTVTANRTLVANYSPITYTITTASSPQAGGTTSGGGTFSPSATATVTASPATGYQFVGWTEGGTTVSTSSTYSFLVSANRSLVATFQSISYLTVNTLANPSPGGTATGSGTYSAGTIVTVRATEATGYNFVNWSEGGSTVSSSESYTFTLNTNRTLVANFSPISYTVATSSSPSAGGTTSGGGAFIYGDAVTVTAVPASGYQFVNWTQGGTAVSTNSSYSFTLTGNRTLTANFSQNAYTISTSSSPANGGTTSGGGSFSHGDNATVSAVPSTGYTFVNWTQGGTVVSTNASYSFTVTSGLTLVANFSQITYTVALSSAPAAGGTTSGAGTYGSGTTATVTATPATGYRFVNWTQGGTAASANPVYSFPVTANITLVANFAVADYTITTTVSPAGAGTASGGGSFNHGASVTVRATPATGYQFTNWTENGSAVSTSANYTFTVSGSRNLLANFSQIPRLLTLTGPGGNNLRNNDIISLDSPEGGSMVITVNANADWSVTENSLWFNAIKEGDSRIRINYLENILVIDKESPLKVSTALNAEIQVIVRQEARISQLSISKFDDVIIYPNPAGDRTRLLFPRELQGRIRVTLSSVQGIPVKTSDYADIQANQTVELDLTGIRPGQYLMIISDETDQKTFGMIKF